MDPKRPNLAPEWTNLAPTRPNLVPERPRTAFVRPQIAIARRDQVPESPELAPRTPQPASDLACKEPCFQRPQSKFRRAQTLAEKISLAFRGISDAVSIYKSFFDCLVTLAQLRVTNLRATSVFTFSNFHHLPFFIREKPTTAFPNRPYLLLGIPIVLKRERGNLHRQSRITSYAQK